MWFGNGRDVIGWDVFVYRQLADHTTPADLDVGHGEQLAGWEAELHGIDWLDELADDFVIRQGGNGYPSRYTARADVLIPLITAGPPGERIRSTFTTDLPVTFTPVRTLQTDEAVVVSCGSDEWLIIDVWDQS